MTYLFDQLVSLKLQLKNRVMLFLDYDGTLTPIVETPDKARLSKGAKNLLIALSKTPKFQLTIISGRGLADVEQLVGVKNITYVGNHGFEIKGPGMDYQGTVNPAYKVLVDFLKKEIALRFSALPAVFIEDKGMSICVHYRRVNSDQAAIVEYILYQMTQVYMMRKELALIWGKRVCEIKPPHDWNKGKAVQWVLERQHSFPVYIGDDTTDEDAFIALKDHGITVYVGNEDYSHAKYYVKDPDDVIRFLRFLHQGKVE